MNVLHLVQLGLLLHIQFIQPIRSLDGSFFLIRVLWLNGTDVPIEVTPCIDIMRCAMLRHTMMEMKMMAHI